MNLRTIFKVEDMSCQHCKMRIENSLKLLQNIKNFSVDLLKKEVVVEGSISPEEIKSVIIAAGYNAVQMEKT